METTINLIRVKIRTVKLNKSELIYDKVNTTNQINQNIKLVNDKLEIFDKLNVSNGFENY